MLRYTLFIALLLQCLSINICENSRSRIDMKNRYSPGHNKFHSTHQHLVSPINLLNPDKYEYFTINNQGNIIKRLMTSKEIQSIVAGNNIKQNVFDKLESPHGIITNIVSSIKNVLNTELLSKNHENQDNNVNGFIAEVTSSESSEKDNEYVPAILNLVEFSSQYGNEENLSDIKFSATKCPNNCNVENDATIDATTSVSNLMEHSKVHAEKTTEITTHQPDENKNENILMSFMLTTNLTEPTEKATESTPHQPDENKIENILMPFMLANNLTESTEKTMESTTHQPDENKIENILMSFMVTTNQTESTEKTTESTSHQPVEKTTEKNVLSFMFNNLKEYTENTTESTTLQPDENIFMSFMLTNNLTDSTETATESTPHQLEEKTTEKNALLFMFNNLPESTEKIMKSTPHQPDENIIMSFMLTNNLTKSTEMATESTPHQPEEKITEKNAPSFMFNNLKESTEKTTESTPHQPDENEIENILMPFMSTTNLTESTERATESTPRQPDENILMSFMLMNNQTESTETATESTPHQLEEKTTEKDTLSFMYNNLMESTEKTTESTPHQTNENKIENILMSFKLTTNLTESTETGTKSTPHQPEEKTTEKNALLFMFNNLMEFTEKATESTPYQTDETTSEKNVMSFIINNPMELTEKVAESTPHQTDEKTTEKIVMSTVHSTLAGDEYSYDSTTLSSETFTQTPPTSLISIVDDESTKIDLQTKLITQQTDNVVDTTLQESTTEIKSEEYSLKTENIMPTDNTHTTDSNALTFTEAYSTLDETTNNQETTSFMAPQTTNSKIYQQLTDEPTTLTIDTQNAFFMIMELLKGDNRNEESIIYHYEKENVIIDSQETTEEEEEEKDEEEEYSTVPLELTTTQVTIDTPTNADQFTTTEALYTNLPDSFDTTASTEQSFITTMGKTKYETTPLTTTLKSTTAEKHLIMSTSPRTTTSTHRRPTVRPTNQFNDMPLKAEQSAITDLHKASSNEFVSIAEMILRQANTVPYATIMENTNVDNLLDLLSVTNKNMISYVNETATVASVLSHTPLKKTQPINTETSEHDVFQSFLSITNDLKQGILPTSTEDADNRITNDLFQKLGESEGRRNTSFSDQLSTSDIQLNNQNEEDFQDESDENDQDESREMSNFFKHCNRIGMDMYQSMISMAEFQQSKSFAFSPFSAISLLSMLHLGARGKTADKINKLIGLDEMTSFNPHLTFKTISQAIEDENTNSYFVRMLFSDENRGKLQNFFKTKVIQLYSGYAEEISFNDRNMITNRVNILVNNSTQGAQSKFLEDFEIQATPPLCLISANSYEIGCPSKDDDSKIFFHIIDARGKRKLVELAAAVYTGSFFFGYNTEMDVTVASIFSERRDTSTIFLMPGQQGGTIERNSLLNLENNVLKHNFSSKIKQLEVKLKPHLSSILHIPHFNQQSFVNVSDQLHQLGLGELFNGESSNLRGIQESTATPIHLSEVLQINRVSLCNEDRKKKSSDMFSSFLDMKSNLRKYIEKAQSAKDQESMLNGESVVKLDKPFLYIIRHNPSQLILYVGRFNPVE